MKLLLKFSLALFLVGGSLAASSRSAPQPDIFARGLKIWRKAGAINDGAACATCHSPDGIELAEYTFDDPDIRRRAQPHLGHEDTETLIAYVHALRSKLGLARLRDPNADRPLQPDGSVLPGKTPAERDLAFGQELQSRLPDLFSGRIDTLDKAKAAEAQLLALPATNLRVGIPFNRLSEDVAHGNQHSSIAQWLPEIPPAIPAAKLHEWYRAEDRYLQSPTQANLHDLLIFHSHLVDTTRLRGFEALSSAKFRALLVLTDRMRNHTEDRTEFVTPDVLAYGNFNPIWAVGDLAREMMGRGPGEFGMNHPMQTKKLAGAPLEAQLSQMRVAWFWAGWLSDQGMFKTSHDDKTRLGLWMSESLSEDGPYPFHEIYAEARRQAVVSNVPESWGETPARKRRIWDFAGLRSFNRYRRDLPTEPSYRQLYIAFVANCFRMNLLLLKDDIDRTGVVWVRSNTKGEVHELVNFIKTYDPGDGGFSEKLGQDIDALADKATDRF